MYKKRKSYQETFFDFNQGFGIPIDEKNRWVVLSKEIPWEEMEDEYASYFSKDKGAGAIPFRIALGSLIIKGVYNISDRKVTKEIQENPYLQYFIGLNRYTNDPPFDPSMLTNFRKRITGDMLRKCNELIRYSKKKYHLHQTKNDQENSQAVTDNAIPHMAEIMSKGIALGAQTRKDAYRLGNYENKGQIIMDASCCPVHIKFPTDAALLNTARTNVQEIIGNLCAKYSLKKPRLYKRVAQKEYLSFAKTKKPSKGKIRSIIKKMLSYLKRNLARFEDCVVKGAFPTRKDLEKVMTAKEIYDQQKYMYENHVHRIENRIVSFHMPFIRPIKRGKQAAETEFGPKIDISIDENGFAGLEYFSFDNYNEGNHLMDIVESYHKRTGRYPESVLADQIYRTRANRNYCKKRNIRLSGPRIGKKPSDTDKLQKQKKTEKKDQKKRISVERHFSREKQCFGIGKVMAKLPETIEACIALAVLLDNIIPKNF